MSNIPGLIQPTINSYPPGANSPATAAKAINDANNLKLHNINQMAAGSKKRYKKGGASQIVVPVIKPIYTSQNGPGTDTTSQQALAQSISMQSTANKAYDNEATKMGGSRRKYKRRRTNRKKNKKNKKKTRRH